MKCLYAFVKQKPDLNIFLCERVENILSAGYMRREHAELHCYYGDSHGPASFSQ